MKKTEELKTCPYCGSSEYASITDHPVKLAYIVQCFNCNALGHML